MTTLNYVPAVTYQPINFVGNVQLDGYGRVGNWVMSYFASAKVASENKSTDYQVVNVVDAGSQSTTEPTYVTWIGRSKNYVDSLNITLQYRRSYTGTDQYGEGVGYIGNTSNAQLYFVRYGRFYPGYYADLNANASTIWKPDFYLYNAVQSSHSNKYFGVTEYASPISRTVQTSVEIKEVSEDGIAKEYDYEHIVTYGNLSGYKVCDPDWLNSLRGNGVKKGTDLKNSTTTGRWGGSQENSASGSIGSTKAPTSMAGYYRGDYGTQTANFNLPTVGLLNKSYTSNTIYQSDNKFKQSVDKETYEADKVLLTKGFQLLAANKDDTIEWTPVFKDSKFDGTTSTKNIELYLSVGPFGSEITPESSSTIIRDEGYYESNKAVRNYFVISDLTKKIKFKMPTDGIVYAKWRHENFDNTKNWEISLDLTKCDSYQRTKLR